MIILRTLGTASIEIDDTAVVAPSAPRRFAVLLYLAVERGREISREQLANLVFSDQSSSDAAHSLREVMYQLRRVRVPIIARPTGFTIAPDDVRPDYEDVSRSTAIDEETLRAMAGGFLPTFTPVRNEVYAEWLDSLRAAQTLSLTRRLLPDLDEAMRTGAWPLAERLARACLGLDAWNERATFALAELLAIGGSTAPALQLLDRYVDEFGPNSVTLVHRADALRRRIQEDLRKASRGSSRRNGTRRDYGANSSPRLVGRDAEMAALLETFDDTRAGESQCVIVAGEAGIGKTRLVADFSAVASLRGAHVARVTSQPHDGNRPMGAFVDLVPGLLGAPGALGCSPASMEALRSLTEQRVGADSSQAPASPDEHEQRWTAVSRAVMDLCEAIASEQSLILVIEDAHWLDALSSNTIGRIVGTRREARILVIVTTRDARPVVRDVRLTDRCQTLSLAPLTVPAADELLTIVLSAPSAAVRERRDTPADPAIKAKIATISAGNPLFLISLAGHSRVHGGPFQVPGTIVEMFGQRIDALSRQSMIVLATCAELGKHGTVKRLVRALELRKHQLAESLLELCDTGLVLRDGENAIPAHPLVSEALRSRLPQPARRAVAHSVAGTLEVDAEERESSALWWDVAASWTTANNPDKAIAALKRCARHALEIGRPGEAARILNEAANHTQSNESLQEVSEALIHAANASNDSRLVLHGAALRRRVTATQSHDDLELAELRASLQANLSGRAIEQLLHCLTNEEASALHRVSAGLALLKASDTIGSEPLRARVTTTISNGDLSTVPTLSRLEFNLLVAVTARDWPRAAEIAVEILSECRPPGKQANAAYVQNAAIALMFAGHLRQSLEALELAYAIGVSTGSAHSQLAAACLLAQIHVELGDDAERQSWIDASTAIVRDAPHLASDFDYVIGGALRALYAGQPEQVEATLSEADALELFSSPVRSRWKRALQLGIQILKRPLTDDDNALALTILDDPLDTLNGVRDLEMSVACHVLAARGSTSLAAEALVRFLQAERGHFALLSPMFARAMHMAGLQTGSLREIGRYGEIVPYVCDLISSEQKRGGLVRSPSSYAGLRILARPERINF